VLFVIVLLFPCISFALDPTKAITQYVHDVWLEDQGLPQSSVDGIVQTPDGYLWIGTQQGLARFDGVRFAVFDSKNTPQMTNEYIWTLLVDHEGTLWIGTYGGGLLQYKNGKFRAFTKKDGLSNDIVRCLFEDTAGNLWIGTDDGGLNRFKNDQFQTFT